MIAWGISANSHNAALAVFDNNELVFASESERFSKKKNDPHLDTNLIKYARRFGEPSAMHWYENPYLKTLRQAVSGQGFTLAENNIKKYLESYNINVPIDYHQHHETHAAAGYYTSNFDQACVVVIDAIGEFDTLTIWKATGNKLKKIYAQRYPHSVGIWYSAMTQRCGLKPNEEEYILMGMAAFGDPNRLKQQMLEDFISYETSKIVLFKQNLHRGCKQWMPELTSQQDMYDIAAATQSIYEDIFQTTMLYAKTISGSENLVLMGGCALNCSANRLAPKFFDKVWIMPAPGDSGSSIGAVLAKTKQHIHWQGPYLGYDMGYVSSNEDIVDYLVQHKVCGVARGRAEIGPRALGNRSLLADPRGPEIKGLINNIKRRQQFRPFSPSIMAEFANQHFKMPLKSTPYMQFIAPILEYGSYSSVAHIDQTSRVQTVTHEDNPQFRQLLELWYKRTGCPMLLNTSLNIKGQPMVNDRADSDAWFSQYGIKIFN
jgi:carbamoyltransferase